MIATVTASLALALAVIAGGFHHRLTTKYPLQFLAAAFVLAAISALALIFGL